jgi:ParB family chromosome partitioning protein
MQLLKKYGLLESNRVFVLKITEIRPNPAQPRSVFDSDSLQELASSIREFGVIQPLTVRRREGYYELVSGERRLRASRLAGLEEVPCILVGVDERQSSLIALIENLQRQDLDFFEEAHGIEKLIRAFGLSQEQAAARLGLSQSAVANKLRLLRHSTEIAARIREQRLTERHARALLRLEDDADKRAVLREIIAQQMNVAQTDEYITQVLERKLQADVAVPFEELKKTIKPVPKEKNRIRTLYYFKDVRLFLNSITRAIDTMRRSGVDTHCDKEETDEVIRLTIHIPKVAGKR